MRHAKCYTAILREPLLSAMGKALYGSLKSYTSEKDNRAWPSQETLAAQLGSTPKTIRWHLQELVYFGIMAEWNKGYSGTANTYFLTDEKAAANIARGEGPKLPYDPGLKLPTKETHSNATLQHTQACRA